MIFVAEASEEAEKHFLMHYDMSKKQIKVIELRLSSFLQIIERLV
jgi:hypothetical protein